MIKGARRTPRETVESGEKGLVLRRTAVWVLDDGKAQEREEKENQNGSGARDAGRTENHEPLHTSQPRQETVHHHPPGFPVCFDRLFDIGELILDLCAASAG